MSLNTSGVGNKVLGRTVSIEIENKHPLIVLANELPWDEITSVILEDLKQTAGGQWWTGRPLMIRIHLAAFLLQKINDLKDRETEYLLISDFEFLGVRG